MLQSYTNYIRSEKDDVKYYLHAFREGKIYLHIFEGVEKAAITFTLSLRHRPHFLGETGVPSTGRGNTCPRVGSLRQIGDCSPALPGTARHTVPPFPCGSGTSPASLRQSAPPAFSGGGQVCMQVQVSGWKNIHPSHIVPARG